MANPLIRNVVAVTAGLLAAFLTVMIVENIGHMFFPPPAGLDMTIPADQARMMDAIPQTAKLAVVFAWFMGAFAGAWVAIRISGSVLYGWLIGLLISALSLFTTQMFPHPFWMVVAAAVIPLVAVLVVKRILTSGSVP